MKKIIIALAGIALISSACTLNSGQSVAQTDLQDKYNQLSTKNEELQQQLTQVKADLAEVKNTVASSTAKATDIALNGDFKVCAKSILGFEFSYPKNWGDCKVVGNKIYFRTSYEKYQVDLVAEITKTNEKIIPDYTIEKEVINEKYTIYSVVCGGGLFCSGLKDGNNFYSINWDLATNQPAPKEADGMWNPENNLKDGDIFSILKTIK
jgi:hypothetical protein